MAHAISFRCESCSYCSGFWREVVRHTFETHSNEPNFTVACVVDGCCQTFQRYSSLTSHLVRKHKGKDLELEARNSSRFSTSTSTSTSESSLGCTFEDGNVVTEDQESDCIHEPNVEHLHRSAGLFLLSIKELTQAAVDFALGQVREMISLAVDDVHRILESSLREHSITIPDVPNQLEILRDPFASLSTEYMQTKYYREHFGLVEPVTITLGTALNSKKDTYQYVPLLEGLKSLLSKDEILDEILRERAREDELIADFCDGSLLKSHPLFQTDPYALQLVAYFDEAEICNPLGSHKGQNKIGVFYYTIGNLRPELRSTHRCIQLISCITCPLLERYEFERVLHPFIRDVNELCENGISITRNGHTMIMRGAVIAFLADTVAAHQLGGFKVGVNFALRKCRVCMATDEDLQVKFTESGFILRSPASHDHHCSLLDGPYASTDSTTYGVNSRGPLNDLSHFHVASGHLPKDIMHVIFEGVLPLETKMMLHVLIYDKKYFSLGMLNSRLESFAYSRNESRTKPPKPFQKESFVGDGKLQLSSSQMWTFATILPLKLATRFQRVILTGNLFYCYCKLYKSVQLARISSSSSVSYLAALIDQHHHEFKQCYPTRNMPPKMHYMVHFPEQILRLGPLVASWCMRMEAKNSYFKKVGRISNFKNVAYSIANRHQKLLCAYLQCGKFFTYEELHCGPCKVLSSECTYHSSHPKRDEILCVLPELGPESIISHPKWISIYGEEYHHNDFVLMGRQADDLPIFAKITSVMVVMGYVILSVDVFKTQGLCNHLMSYQIERTLQSTCIALSRLNDRHPYTSHTFDDGQLYIIMRSHIEISLLQLYE